MKGIELFCGAGGLSCGLGQAGIEIIAGLDHEPVSLDTFVRNHRSTDHFFDPIDLTKLRPRKLRDALSMEEGELDLIVGGPPCQGFSTAGARDPDDERSTMVAHYLRLVVAMKPRFVVMENVAGINSMKTSKGIPVTEMVAQRLERAGYMTNVDEKGKFPIFDTSHYGVPQRRRRAVLLAVRRELWTGPLPVLERVRGWQTPVTVKQALWDLPEPVAMDPQSWDKSGRKPSAYAKRLRANIKSVWNHGPTNHRPDMIKKMAKQEQGKALYDTWAHAWVKLLENEPAPTVKENHNAPFVHPWEPRVVTPRECARLQSFPDRFKFQGPKSQQLVQIGNAVPPLFAKAIGLAIMKADRDS